MNTLLNIITAVVMVLGPLFILAEPENKIYQVIWFLSVVRFSRYVDDCLCKNNIHKITNEYTTVYNPNMPNQVVVHSYPTMNSRMWHFDAKIGAMTMKA